MAGGGFGEAVAGVRSRARCDGVLAGGFDPQELKRVWHYVARFGRQQAAR